MAKNERRIVLRSSGYTIDIRLWDVDGQTCGDILSDMRENNGEDDVEFNAAIDGIEALILAQACAGIDVQSEEYLSALSDAIEAICNNL